MIRIPLFSRQPRPLQRKSGLRPGDDADPGCHYLLIRRNDHTGELAYLRCYSHARSRRLRLVGYLDELGAPSQIEWRVKRYANRWRSYSLQRFPPFLTTVYVITRR